MKNLKGSKNPFYGKHHTEEARQKISKARKGHKLSEEHKRKISQSLKGKGKGRKFSKEHRKNLSMALTNPSKETRQKMSKAQKGRKLTEKTKQKMSEARKGYKHSQEAKEKMGQKGSKSSSWKGGQYKSRGRIFIYSPEHPFANNIYVLRSRLVMEKKLGRHLKPKEVVHHINGIVNDDRPENLQLFPNRGAHISFHHHKAKIHIRMYQ